MKKRFESETGIKRATQIATIRILKLVPRKMCKRTILDVYYEKEEAKCYSVWKTVFFLRLTFTPT